MAQNDVVAKAPPVFPALHPMTIQPLMPKGEGLRRAVAWLAEHGEWTPGLVEEASRRFDLDPADEEFLLREARLRAARGHSAGDIAR
jgi:hypothetical protein